MRSRDVNAMALFEELSIARGEVLTRADLARRAREMDERELEPEEFNRLVQEALSDEEEMRKGVELIRWFQQRYPTVPERFAYVRQKMREIRESALGASEGEEADQGPGLEKRPVAR